MSLRLQPLLLKRERLSGLNSGFRVGMQAAIMPTWSLRLINDHEILAFELHMGMRDDLLERNWIVGKISTRTTARRGAVTWLRRTRIELNSPHKSKKVIFYG